MDTNRRTIAVTVSQCISPVGRGAGRLPHRNSSRQKSQINVSGIPRALGCDSCISCDICIIVLVVIYMGNL
jgi:hypothetical protein